MALLWAVPSSCHTIWMMDRIGNRLIRLASMMMNHGDWCHVEFQDQSYEENVKVCECYSVSFS